MARVRDVRLQIEPATTRVNARFSLIVTYVVEFEQWEGSSWFREVVAIVGIVDGKEVDLAMLTADPISSDAASDGASKRMLERSTPRFELEATALDVDPAALFIGPSRIRLVMHRDDIMARVSLEPLLPEPHSEVSNVVSAFFEVGGAAC